MAAKTKIGTWIVGAVMLFVGVRCTMDGMEREDKANAKRAQAAAAEAAMTPAEKASAAAAKSAKDRKEALFQEGVSRARLAVGTLKASMKDPDSFKVSQAVLMDSGAVCIVYRAKNSFAAVVPNSAVAASGATAVSLSANDYNRLCAKHSGTDLEPAL